MLMVRQLQITQFYGTPSEQHYLPAFFITAALIPASAAFLTYAYHAVVYVVACAVGPAFLFALPTVTLILCSGVALLKHPVHSLMCLISVFFSTVVLYLFLGAEFLAFLFLIVYVGAIAILFLFVVMLLQLKVAASSPILVGPARTKFMAASALAAILGLTDVLSSTITTFLAVSGTVTFQTVATTTEGLVHFVNNKFADILLFSDLLYTYHCILFFISGLLLLTAMLGAIILATNATYEYKPEPVPRF